MLTIGCVTVEAYGLKTKHGTYLISARKRCPDIYPATHARGLKKWRLFVHKSDETHRACWPLPGNVARKLEHSRQAAAVVISPGAAKHGIVVRADQHDFGRVARSRYLKITHVLAAGFMVVADDLETLIAPRSLDVICCLCQRNRTKDIALADLTGKSLHVRTKPSHKLIIFHGLCQCVGLVDPVRHCRNNQQGGKSNRNDFTRELVVPLHAMTLVVSHILRMHDSDSKTLHSMG